MRAKNQHASGPLDSDQVSGSLQAGQLANRESGRQAQRDVVAVLARQPMTVGQIASRLIRGRRSVDIALARLEADGKVRRSHTHSGPPPVVWSLTEGADDGPAE